MPWRPWRPRRPPLEALEAAEAAPGGPGGRGGRPWRPWRPRRPPLEALEAVEAAEAAPGGRGALLECPSPQHLQKNNNTQTKGNQSPMMQSSVLDPAVQSSKLGFPELLLILLVAFLILVAAFAIGRKVFRVK